MELQQWHKYEKWDNNEHKNSEIKNKSTVFDAYFEHSKFVKTNVANVIDENGE